MIVFVHKVMLSDKEGITVVRSLPHVLTNMKYAINYCSYNKLMEQDIFLTH